MPKLQITSTNQKKRKKVVNKLKDNAQKYQHFPKRERISNQENRRKQTIEIIEA